MSLIRRIRAARPLVQIGISCCLRRNAGCSNGKRTVALTAPELASHMILLTGISLNCLSPTKKTFTTTNSDSSLPRSTVTRLQLTLRSWGWLRCHSKYLWRSGVAQEIARPRMASNKGPRSPASRICGASSRPSWVTTSRTERSTDARALAGKPRSCLHDAASPRQPLRDLLTDSPQPLVGTAGSLHTSTDPHVVR